MFLFKLYELFLFLKRKISPYVKNRTDLGFLILNWLLVILQIKKLEVRDSDKDENGGRSWEKLHIHKNYTYHTIDYLFINANSIYFNFFHKKSNFYYMDLKIKQLKNNNMYLFNNNVSIFSIKQLSLYGLESIWSHIRLWVLPLLICFCFIYYSLFLKLLPFSKIFAGYLLVGNMFYLLFSGFVFFFKKYQYRLYTSVIQRFWRRTLIIFWAIEGSLFVCFVYLIFNASQEPLLVYDNVQIYKTHFYSWRFFLVKILLSSLIITLTYILLLSLKWNTFSKTNNLTCIITIILLYVAWMEFYQFFHLMNCYGNIDWVYDYQEHLWDLELEFKKTRIVNHYVTIGLIAKFWHIVFAVIFWLFFLLRGLESSRYRYALLAANLQNFLIIYFMGWLYMYPWVKFILRKSLDMPYFWFFVNNRRFGAFLFFNDIKLFYWGFVDYFFENNSKKVYKSSPYYYWHESSIILNNTQFRKHNIRDFFIKNLI
jgi:hypothetical protein